MPFTITMDGPVGAGKSSIADAVAMRLNICHLDTGAMYRTAALYILRAKCSPASETAVVSICENGEIHVDVSYVDGIQHTLLNGEDVTALIRTQEVGEAASVISQYPAVRKMLVAEQRKIAASQSVLLDGRDCGTVVLPQADLKIYLTASAEVRAQRRLLQLQAAGQNATFESIIAEVNERDHRDMTRKTDPLRQAEDAVLIDSSELTIEETIEKILQLVEERNGNKA